jgi:hypothetical protein
MIDSKTLIKSVFKEVNMKNLCLAILVSVLIVALLFYNFGFLDKPQIEKSSDFFVGVDVAYADLAAIKTLIDEINPYTNLFVIGSTGITYNVTKLNEVCKYVYDRGMYFMIYMHQNPEQLDIQRQWVANARSRWPQNFIGLYAYDEPGGRTLDYSEYRISIEAADNYTDAGDMYVNQLKEILMHIREDPINSGNLTLFTSDYALYWYDYKADYDVVFAEFGWNYSRQLNIALDRGAATVQNKDWGVMITWTYNHPPYIESGTELYNDLVLAYENGAKYILVFDSNKNYTEGILEEEHFEALEQFLQYTKNNPRNNQVEKRIAFVLPKGCGYGFRGPDDKIWGIWEADARSLEISYHLGSFLEEYGTNLDIIYDDKLELDETYSKYIFWNGTIIPSS